MAQEVRLDEDGSGDYIYITNSEQPAAEPGGKK